MQEIVARHWLEMGHLQGASEEVQSILNEISAQGPSITTRIGRSLPAEFPANVAEPILDGLLRAIRTKLI